jgi:mRNA-degrading endonuclease RelE of RelBE toxin-antitoxin system
VKIIYTTRAAKQLAKLPRQQADAVLTSCAGIENWPPQHADVKKLANRPDWRLRVGRFRVIFELDTEEAVIVITQIVIRDDRTY